MSAQKTAQARETQGIFAPKCSDKNADMLAVPTAAVNIGLPVVSAGVCRLLCQLLLLPAESAPMLLITERHGPLPLPMM